MGSSSHLPVAVSITSTLSACDGIATMYAPLRVPPCHLYPPRPKAPISSIAPVSGVILSADGALNGMPQIEPSSARMPPYHLFFSPGWSRGPTSETRSIGAGSILSTRSAFAGIA